MKNDDSEIYITENVGLLMSMRLERLVKHRIWKTKKGNEWKFQSFDHMNEKHLRNAINSFRKTTNHIVLGALTDELERRIALTNKHKQKIKQINQMNIVDNNTETLIEASKVAASLDIAENIEENYFEQVFKKGDNAEGYNIMDVKSTNCKGYLYTVQKGDEIPFEISQSKFLKMIGHRPAINLKEQAKQAAREAKRAAKKAEAKKQKAVSTNTKTVNADEHIPQKYNVGDIVGRWDILDCAKNPRCPNGGYSYLVRDKLGKKKNRWIKQCKLQGKHIKAKTNNILTIDDYSMQDYVNKPKIKVNKPSSNSTTSDKSTVENNKIQEQLQQIHEKIEELTNLAASVKQIGTTADVEKKKPTFIEKLKRLFS